MKRRELKERKDNGMFCEKCKGVKFKTKVKRNGVVQAVACRKCGTIKDLMPAVKEVEKKEVVAVEPQVEKESKETKE